MRLVIVGCLLFVVTVLYILPIEFNFTGPFPPQVLQVFLPVVAVFIIYEGLTLLGKTSAPPHFDRLMPSTTAKIEKLQGKIEENVVELDRMREENTQLTRKNREVEQELRKTKQQLSGTIRDSRIDAELVNLLAVLQERGRLIDFLMDDIAPYADEQVGGAARVVHQGCAEVLREYFTVESIESGEEGSRITLQPDFDAKRYRLLGKVAGEPPFRGKMLHHGWWVSAVRLPRVVVEGSKVSEGYVLAPTEVEIAA